MDRKFYRVLEALGMENGRCVRVSGPNDIRGQRVRRYPVAGDRSVAGSRRWARADRGRAGKRVSGCVFHTLRCLRMRSITSTSSMSAMMRMVVPQRVHLSGSTSYAAQGSASVAEAMDGRERRFSESAVPSWPCAGCRQVAGQCGLTRPRHYHSRRAFSRPASGCSSSRKSAT